MTKKSITRTINIKRYKRKQRKLEYKLKQNPNLQAPIKNIGFKESKSRIVNDEYRSLKIILGAILKKPEDLQLFEDHAIIMHHLSTFTSQLIHIYIGQLKKNNIQEPITQSTYEHAMKLIATKDFELSEKEKNLFNAFNTLKTSIGIQEFEKYTSISHLIHTAATQMFTNFKVNITTHYYKRLRRVIYLLIEHHPEYSKLEDDDKSKKRLQILNSIIDRNMNSEHTQFQDLINQCIKDFIPGDHWTKGSLGSELACCYAKFIYPTFALEAKLEDMGKKALNEYYKKKTNNVIESQDKTAVIIEKNRGPIPKKTFKKYPKISKKKKSELSNELIDEYTIKKKYACFQSVPIKSSFIIGYYGINSQSLLYIGDFTGIPGYINKRKTMDELGKDPKKKKMIWGRYFNLNHPIFQKQYKKGYRFDYSISTDGFGCTLKFVPKTKPTYAESGYKKSKLNPKKSSDVNEIDNDVSNESINPKTISDTNEIDNGVSNGLNNECTSELSDNKTINETTLSSKKLIKPKIIKKIPVKKHKAPVKPKTIKEKGWHCPQISDLDPNDRLKLANRKLAGVDPGYKNLVVIVSGSKANGTFKKYVYKASHRKLDTQFFKIQKTRNKLRKQHSLNELEKPLSATNSKSLDVEIFLEYIKVHYEVSLKVNAIYQNIVFRKIKYYSQLRAKSSLEKLVNDIKRIFGPDVVLLYGNWSRSTQMKGLMPVPGLGIKKRLARSFEMYDVDEYCTSKMCCNCHKELKNKVVIDKNTGQRKEIYRVLVCDKCIGEDGKMIESRHIHRDINGAVDILKLGKLDIEGKPRPEAFCRKPLDTNKSKTQVKTRSKKQVKKTISNKQVKKTISKKQVKIISNKQTIKQEIKPNVQSKIKPNIYVKTQPKIKPNIHIKTQPNGLSMIENPSVTQTQRQKIFKKINPGLMDDIIIQSKIKMIIIPDEYDHNQNQGPSNDPHLQDEFCK